MFPQPVTPHGSEGQRFPMAPWGALCSCWESTDAFCRATSQKNGTLSKFTPLHSQPRLGRGSLKVMPTVPIQKKKEKKKTFLSAPGTVQTKSSLFKECNPNLKCNLWYVFPKSQILLFSGKGVYAYHSMVVSEVKV